MNKYPKWWDSTITVYNRYQDPTTDIITWQRTVLTDCFWKHVSDRVSINQTVLETDAIVVRIPKNDKFIEKYKWVELPNDEMSNYFTLGVGDIIVYDNADFVIDEYKSKMHSSDLIAKYKDLQGCITIQEFSNNVGFGKGIEHYRVKGV